MIRISKNPICWKTNNDTRVHTYYPVLCIGHWNVCAFGIRTDHDLRGVCGGSPIFNPADLWPLAHERPCPDGHPIVHNGRWHHGEGADRSTFGGSGQPVCRPFQGWAVCGRSCCFGNLRFHLGFCIGNADLHRVDHVATASGGELSTRLIGCNRGERSPSGPSNPAQFFADHLCLGDEAVGA